MLDLGIALLDLPSGGLEVRRFLLVVWTLVRLAQRWQGAGVSRATHQCCVSRARSRKEAPRWGVASEAWGLLLRRPSP